MGDTQWKTEPAILTAMEKNITLSIDQAYLVTSIKNKDQRIPTNGVRVQLSFNRKRAMLRVYQKRVNAKKKRKTSSTRQIIGSRLELDLLPCLFLHQASRYFCVESAPLRHFCYRKKAPTPACSALATYCAMALTPLWG